jgi:hypothetical protein
MNNINKTLENNQLMKINQPLIIRSFLLITSSLLAAGQLQAQISITGGNLYVLQDGSGTATTYQDGGGSISAGSGSGSAIFIDQFSTSANGLIAQTAVPTTATAGVGLLTTADTPQAGQLYYDSMNNSLVFGGYSGTAVGASKSTANPDLGKVNSSGAFSFAVQSAGPQYTTSSGLIRAGTTDGSGNYWASGTGASGQTGIYYYGNNSSLTVLNSGIAGRAIGAYSGNLYYTTGSGTAGLYMYSGLPTSGTPSPTLLANTGGTPYGFFFNPGMTILYIANESGGIQKWTYNGTSWSQAYTLDSGVDFDWVTANFSGGNPVLYATSLANNSSGNSIYTITDTGSGSGATLLDTIAASSSVAGDFDGIVFVASVPEPSVYALAGLGLVLFLGNRRMRKA